MLQRACSSSKGVLKECHTIFIAGVGAGVPLNFSAVSGSGSATQEIKECWTRCFLLKFYIQCWVKRRCVTKKSYYLDMELPGQIFLKTFNSKIRSLSKKSHGDKKLKCKFTKDFKPTILLFCSTDFIRFNTVKIPGNFPWQMMSFLYWCSGETGNRQAL